MRLVFDFVVYLDFQVMEKPIFASIISFAVMMMMMMMMIIIIIDSEQKTNLSPIRQSSHPRKDHPPKILYVQGHNEGLVYECLQRGHLRPEGSFKTRRVI